MYLPIDVPGVGRVSVARLDELLGTLATVVVAKGVAVQDVTFDQRDFPEVVHIAALEPSPRCVDCGSTLHLEGDHRIPRSLGGATSLANYAARCRYDHQTKTVAEARITIPAGRRAAAESRREPAALTLG